MESHNALCVSFKRNCLCRLLFREIRFRTKTIVHFTFTSSTELNLSSLHIFSGGADLPALFLSAQERHENYPAGREIGSKLGLEIGRILCIYPEDPRIATPLGRSSCRSLKKTCVPCSTFFCHTKRYLTKKPIQPDGLCKMFSN